MSYRWTPVVSIELHNSLLGEEYKDTTCYCSKFASHVHSTTSYETS